MVSILMLWRSSQRSFVACAFAAFALCAVGCGEKRENILVHGCEVRYSAGLTFSVDSCTFKIDGRTYHLGPKILTLSPDPAYPRVAAVLVDKTPAVIVAYGMASDDPKTPRIRSGELVITYVWIYSQSTYDDLGSEGPRIFDRVLSSAEVSQHYEQSRILQRAHAVNPNPSTDAEKSANIKSDSPKEKD